MAQIDKNIIVKVIKQNITDVIEPNINACDTEAIITFRQLFESLPEGIKVSSSHIEESYHQTIKFWKRQNINLVFVAEYRGSAISIGYRGHQNTRCSRIQSTNE
ncbi:MAG: hypothetical protein Homavirus11_6 [Homavirus sp.]|uniref:Uncharacterized protein n=1 Tax=Homavirus sp. TaxID=2487769 RepID=A0A3G5A4J0_9VIRU|nr:MAG: hypothetical protein Homavirus11_6 [Homavirus sp.]